MPLATRKFEDIITFYRASTAAYWDKDGFLQMAATNEPRSDHDPMTGEPLGILIEEQRTNLLSNTADISGQKGGNKSVEVANSIFGSGSISYKYINDNGDGSPSNPTTVGDTSGDVITVWCILEEGNTLKSSIGLRDVTAGIFAGRVVYHWDTGDLVSSANGSGAMTPIPLGPYILQEVGPNGGRVVMFGVASNALAGNTASILLYPTDNVIGDFSYYHHVQMEVGEFATSPIVTNGAAATRNEDASQVNSLSPWFVQGKGTIFVRGKARPNEEKGQRLFINLNNTSTSEYNALLRITSSGMVATTRFNADSSANLVFPAAQVEDFDNLRAAYSFEADNYAFSVNGLPAIVDSSGGISTSQNILQIGRGFGLNMNGHIKELVYYPYVMAAEKLEEMTA